ncbi:Uncharacterised protein [uncultured archaeon]|nr:Uncharacterised protein [uncultured archaeon]
MLQWTCNLLRHAYVCLSGPHRSGAVFRDDPGHKIRFSLTDIYGYNSRLRNLGWAEGSDVHRCPAGNYHVHRNGHTPCHDLRSSGRNNWSPSSSDEYGFNGAAKSGRSRSHGLDINAYFRQCMVVDDGINDSHGRWNRCIGHASTGNQVHDSQVKPGA